MITDFLFVDIAEEKPHVCPECGMCFKSGYLLQRHSVSHSDERPHECDRCDKSFKVKNALRRHLQEVHGAVESHECDTCGQLFVTVRLLSKHQQAQHAPVLEGERQSAEKEKKKLILDCEVCGKKLMGKNMPRHMIVHTGEKPYECQVCHKRYSDKTILRRHSVIHSGAKPYICELCGENFRFSNQRKRHIIQSHLDVKHSHRCSICNKTFLTKTSLKTHAASHSDERRFKCEYCPKTFRSVHGMKKHFIKMHVSEDPL